MIIISGKKRRHPIHKKKQDGTADLDGVDEKKIKFNPIQIQLKRIDEQINVQPNSSFDEKKPSNSSTGKGNNNFSGDSGSLSAASTPPPKLSFITHPTFGSLPGKHEFGSGLVNNACWPTKVSTVVTSLTDQEETSKNNDVKMTKNLVKMTDTAKQNWMNSFLKKPSTVAVQSTTTKFPSSIDLTKNQIPSNSAGKGNTNLPTAPDFSSIGGQFHLRPPSLTATISKLQNSMPMHSKLKFTIQTY